MDDVKGYLIKGLQSDPKYLPVWYRYDKLGSIYNDRCLSDNSFYYFYRSEVSVLIQHVKEIVDQVQGPCVLVEMGSGNSEKSRMFIDAILEKQTTLKYIPVDISAEFLQEASDGIASDYGCQVEVNPIAGDYSVGINKLRDVSGNKLIIWLGGGFQNQSYDVQVELISTLSKTMTDQDRLIVALDMTQSAKDVQNAYLDPTGISAPLYFNAIWRLNREYGSNIDTEQFVLETTFFKSTSRDILSRAVTRAKSKCDQTYDIPGLCVSVTFKAGEYLHMYEGEGVSCKYNEDQIRTLAGKGTQSLDRLWIAKDNHVAICCIKPA